MVRPTNLNGGSLTRVGVTFPERGTAGGMDAAAAILVGGASGIE